MKVTPVSKARWKSICKDCAGAIDSLVELLQGRFSKGVMERICRQRHGPVPFTGGDRAFVQLPGLGGMCKHVAAVLYGIGARFDQQPELLFRLHEVDDEELIAKAGKGIPLAKTGPARSKVLDTANLADIFGLDIAANTTADGEPPKPRKRKPRTKRS